jgi:hypothetical protein
MLGVTMVKPPWNRRGMTFVDDDSVRVPKSADGELNASTSSAIISAMHPARPTAAKTRPDTSHRVHG